MKTIKELLNQWDEIEQRINALTWARQTFVEARLSGLIDQLKTACRFEDEEPSVRQAWAALERQHSPRQIMEVLCAIHLRGATVGKFMGVLRKSDSLRFRHALALLPNQCGSPADACLSDHWKD